MIIDPDFREVDEPVVTLELSMQQAEWVSNGLSDLLVGLGASTQPFHKTTTTGAQWAFLRHAK